MREDFEDTRARASEVSVEDTFRDDSDDTYDGRLASAIDTFFTVGGLVGGYYLIKSIWQGTNYFVPLKDWFYTPDPSIVQVPVDGDIDPSVTAQVAIHVSDGSPPPRLPIVKAVLPMTHEMDAQPFECLSHDECYFPHMPFYNQGNPNFARVTVPKNLYTNDKSKLTGPLVKDPATKRWALVLPDKTGPTNDPWYNTWLPMGPLSKQDDGYIGHWHTALCAPSSQSMALMAALAAKGPVSRVRPGSWTDTFFVQGRRPLSQEPLPNPLFRDHTTLAPGQRQMTAVELQRVINMAVRQKTSPMAGGGASAFLKLGADFQTRDGGPALETRVVHPVTNKAIADLVRNRFAPVVVLGAYKATLSPVRANGTLQRYDLTLKRTGGHVIAVNGFRGSDILIYDPIYARPIRQTFFQVSTKGATKDGVPIVLNPANNGSLTSLNTLMDDGTTRGLLDLSTLKDGDNIHVVEQALAVRIR